MLNRIAIALALSLAAPALATAQSVPKDADACFEMSSNLLQSAGTLPEDRNQKVQDLLRQLERHCDAGELAEAAAVAKQAKSAIGGN